ncbi:MAG: response regulator transcription factor [Bryobacteraceae bacterium]
MIRVSILADAASRARNLAALLAEDEHFEIVEARAPSRGSDLKSRGIADVVVAAALDPDEIPLNGPPVVVVTGNAPDEMPLERGIRAWLPLDCSAAELAGAILAVASDLSVMTQGQVRRWLRAPGSGHEHEEYRVETLTPRELQVLRILADGLGNKQIAGQLGISDHTAKFHVAQILAKLNAGSRAEAVAIGIRRGLVPI